MCRIMCLTMIELSKMVDTSDEWIMQRIGIKERRILKEKGKATSYMGAKAIKELLKKTGTDPQDIQILICATITADMHFPATANLISDKVGLVNAFSYDLSVLPVRDFYSAWKPAGGSLNQVAIQKSNRSGCRYDVGRNRLFRPYHLSAFR